MECTTLKLFVELRINQEWELLRRFQIAQSRPTRRLAGHLGIRIHIPKCSENNLFPALRCRKASPLLAVQLFAEIATCSIHWLHLIQKNGSPRSRSPPHSDEVTSLLTKSNCIFKSSGPMSPSAFEFLRRSRCDSERSLLLPLPFSYSFQD